MSRRHAVRREVVVDAAAVVDLLLGGRRGVAVEARLRGHTLHAPAHLDAEVLSAFGRLHRGGHIATRSVSQRIRTLAAAPLERHAVPHLLPGAWGRRNNLSLLDALCVELAARLDLPLVTTDHGLARTVPAAEYVRASD